MTPLLHLFFGIWLGTLSLPDANLPFTFELKTNGNNIQLVIRNGAERITCDEVTLQGDSLFVKLPVFDSEFRLAVKDSSMQGVWINHGRKGTPVIPFSAQAGRNERFGFIKERYTNVGGKWEVWFDAGTPDSSLAIGVFDQKNRMIRGTFLTETGDHRFIEGVADGDSIMMSLFDGSHAWLYKARIIGDRIEGTQWSGSHYKGHFSGKRNETIRLRDPEKIAHFEGNLNFRFPDTDSNLVSISDSRYRGKVTVVQILGTWCPNCMDETAFLAEFYKQHHAEGVEMIGLSFERSPDYSVAVKNMRRLIDRYKIDYPLLYAGQANKDTVMKKLEGLKNFISFPSTLFINRKGEVVKVYTGFNGPATGEAYEQYMTDFDKTVRELLK